MKRIIYWFRNDLRLHDNPALWQACARADELLPVVCLGAASSVHNGEARWGARKLSRLR